MTFIAMANRLLWKDIVSPGGVYHLSRAYVAPGTMIGPHRHDFAEVFWIEQGIGLHIVNRRRLPLKRGDLVLMRPDDEHSFGFTGGEHDEPITLVNLAFPVETMHFLKARYFPEPSHWPWRGSELPAQYHIGQAALAELAASIEIMSMTRQTVLELEAFLGSLLLLITRPREHWMAASSGHDAAAHGDRRLPPWLEQTLLQFNEPRYLEEGTPALARLAGRCPEHVNRMLRRHTGRSTTEIVNELRLEYAARQLRLTDRSLLDIAADCGMSSLSHFHHLFKERFDTTPRRYRVRQQAVVQVEKPGRQMAERGNGKI